LLRDVVGLADLPGLCREQSALAEACLVHIAHSIGADDLTIVAMGKFGGSEITYGADLDVLFIGTDIRAAQRLLSTIAQPSAEGNLPRVDARLRPEGDKGPLVSPVETYQRYYETRSQLWELQALTRARPIFGPLQTEFIEVAQTAWRAAGRQPHLYPKIDEMLQRIRRDRNIGSEFVNFKTGTGGIIEAEFLIQATQMRTNLWQPNWAAALDMLSTRGEFSADEATALKAAYYLLRKCESILRRYENITVSTLPNDLFELARLTRRMGSKSRDDFDQRYQSARNRIHQIYQRKMDRDSATNAGEASPALAEQKS
jgi:[glutamine synthetase] adenylyltransferase / [glutamine synthetase]-adenylyl-L-tyrosine phosphorylase